MSDAALLESYRALPLPSLSDEHWRFTDLKGFDPDSFTAAAGADAAHPERLLELDAAAKAFVSEGGVEIGPVPDGVRFELLERSHPRLGQLVPGEEKFSAHNAALWQRGLLVHVPAGVVLERPLYVRVQNSVPNGALFWRLLVVAEPGSRFSLIEEYASSEPDLPGYTNAVVEIFVEPEARVEYVSLQNLSQETWHFASHRAAVDRDAELDWVAGGFGSKRGKTRIENDLVGAGATSRVTGAYFADGDQHLDYDTFQAHIAPSTTSDFAFKGALRERASAVWRGMIKVEKEAQKTNGYQENRNLLLSNTAHADSIPGLEIEANDVRCTHGATISPVDREQLFYARTRGLTYQDAERLIVRGFFQDVLDRVDLAPVRQALEQMLEKRIPQA